MSTYIVIKTINGRQYRYRQTTWREGGRMRTKSEYVGPVAGGGLPDREDGRERSKRRGITGFLQNMVRKTPREEIGETEAQTRERLAAEDSERARNDHINDLLTADTISLDAVAEVADAQAEGESEDSPEGSAE